MRTDAGTAPPRAHRAARYALWGLYLFTAVSVVGYATFGLNPQLIARYPQVSGIYGVSFRFFAQGQVWIAWAALALFLTLHVRARWIPAFCALYLVSLGSELLGTTAGIPFGEYHYTGNLGIRWLGHVPVVIPLSWFFMALPSYAFARVVSPHRAAPRVLLASFLLLSWDLALDPAMSHATAYWVWASPGAYYGMPWLNLFGWYVTGVALMAVLAGLRADGWVARLPLGWLAGFYAANLLLPVGMSAAAGLWGAVAATVAALGAAALLARALAPRGATRPGLAEVAA